MEEGTINPMSTTVTKESIIEVLKTIPDPELNVSIWDLGLVYEVELNEETGDVRVVMTLTSMGCPLFSTIETLVTEKLKEVGVTGNVLIELTFEPPWSMEKMSEEGKAQLGLI
jgi:metal-sulfur cluster biosynthetic enzyme